MKRFFLVALFAALLVASLAYGQEPPSVCAGVEDGKYCKPCGRGECSFEWSCDAADKFVMVSFYCPYGCEDGACNENPQCRDETTACTAEDIPCCSGLKEVPFGYVEMGQCTYANWCDICRPCGNGVCDANENRCNCPEDCEMAGNVTPLMNVTPPANITLAVNVTPPVNITCADSDSGQDFFTRGTVAVNGESYTDECDCKVCAAEGCWQVDDCFELHEFYCDANKLRWAKHTCEYGCQDGACLSKPNCTDSCTAGETLCEGLGYKVCGDYDADPCLEWSSVMECSIGETCEGGACVNVTMNITACIDDCILMNETICSGNGYKSCGNYDSDDCLEWSGVTACQVGIRCASGVCMPECSDSEGENFRMKGNVTGVDVNGSAYLYWDRCVAEGFQLGEMVCAADETGQNVPLRKTYDCPRDTVCEDGACIDVARPKADLTVTDLIIIPSNPRTGDSVSREAKVANLGTKASGVVNIKGYVDGKLVAYGSFGPLQPGATVADYSHNVHWGGPWIALAGTHTFEFVIDADNHETESDETNNRLTKTIVVAEREEEPKADLAVTDLTILPSEPEAGEMVYVTATVKNHGDKESGQVKGKWYLDGTASTEETFSPLTAGAAQEVKMRWILNEGPHTLGYRVDTANAEGERDETNNLFEKDVAVSEKGACAETNTILLCHKPGAPAEQELCVAAEAVPAHMGHGDYLGACVLGKVPEEKVKFSHMLQKVKPEMPVDVVLNRPDTDIQKITFEVDREFTDVRIRFKTQKAAPEDIPLPPNKTVSHYTVIEHPEIGQESIVDTLIEFKVERAWMEENGAEIEDVKLSRFIGGQWTDLATRYVSSDDTYHYFEADSGGLSVFAVTLKEAPAPAQPKPARRFFQSTMFTLAVATVLATTGIGYLYRNRLVIGAKIDDLLSSLRKGREERSKRTRR